MFSSLFPCPLGSVWRAAEGLQTKSTCFVIFPRDETEVHQPVGFTDLLALFEDGCNMWLSLILSVDLCPWLLWPAPGMAPLPRAHWADSTSCSYPSALEALQCRAAVQLQSERQGAAKPARHGHWEEREEMLRKRALHCCTDMGKQLGNG